MDNGFRMVLLEDLFVYMFEMFMKFSQDMQFFFCGGTFILSTCVDFDDVNLGERRLDSKVYGHVA